VAVTVLVPAHNEAGTIDRCLDAIAASTYPVSQIIVVADACTDDTANRARAHGATVLETDCKDKAGAQNTALPLATGEILVGVDADTFMAPDCIARYIEAIEHGGVDRQGLDAVGGTVLPAQDRGFFIRGRQFAYALARRWWRLAQSAVGRVQVLTGASYASKTEAIRAVGGFPSVGISADMDATWTLHRAGYKVEYLGSAMAYTMDPETWTAYTLQMRRWASGYFQTMRKHRRGLLHPAGALVVGTSLLDLLTLPLGYVLLIRLILHHPDRLRLLGLIMAGHLLLTMTLVATVVGWKNAVLGLVPFTLLNFYNKSLYLWVFVREWLLGIHYTAWTGRHGRSVQFTKANPLRVAAVLLTAGILIALLLQR
jgi:cellulose synthase/poly-beta-1,6-N-acetylglucosamine synthase-like glycosyltransferase